METRSTPPGATGATREQTPSQKSEIRGTQLQVKGQSGANRKAGVNQGPATLNPVETGAETRAETGAKTGAETGLPLENKLASGAPYNHGCVEASRGKRRDSRGQTGRLSINRGHLLTHLHNFSIVSAVNFDWIRLWRWVGQWAAGWLGGRGGMSMNRCFRLLSHLEIAGGSNNTPKQHPTTFDNIQQHSTTSNNIQQQQQRPQ